MPTFILDGTLQVNITILAGFYKNKYFPYLNQKGYESPLVAVQFLSPKLNVRIRIVCKAWAKNIDHDRNKKHGFPSGFFEFDLQIQDYDEQI